MGVIIGSVLICFFFFLAYARGRLGAGGAHVYDFAYTPGMKHGMKRSFSNHSCPE